MKNVSLLGESYTYYDMYTAYVAICHYGWLKSPEEEFNFFDLPENCAS